MNAHESKTAPGQVAYLVNQYPLPSHSFIKREIHAVEAAGVPVLRYSIRPTRQELPDEGDRAELARTRSILGGPALTRPLTLGAALLRAAVTRPGRFLAALGACRSLWIVARERRIAHLAWLAEACVLERWLRAAGVVHVHAHFATNSTAVALFCRMLGGPPYSFMVHGPDDFDRARSLSFPRKVHAASFVTAISLYCRGQIWRWCDPADWSKVRILRCGLDESFLDCPSSVPPDVPRFVTVGRLCAAKGQSLLVDAVARLVAEGRTLELVLVGGGELRQDLEQRGRELGIEHCLTFTGFASSADVREQMLSSRAFVSASFAEGLPVVVMEALALRRPVIATRIAAMAELVRDQENGWLVSSGSIDELVDAMRAALDTPPERLARMGQAGARAVAERHDARIEGARLAGWFQDAAGA